MNKEDFIIVEIVTKLVSRRQRLQKKEKKEKIIPLS